MTTQGAINLKGLDQWLEDLARAGKDVDEAASKAILAGAEVIQLEMRVLAPVDTGNLREHIRIKGPIRDGNYHFVEVGVIHEIAFTDADTARYANAQEYGTSKMAAHPYIRPGWDGGRRAALAAMKESLQADGTL